MTQRRAVRAVQTAMMNHCEAMGDRVAILDCPPGMKPQQIREWRMNIATLRLEVRRAVLPLDQGRRPDPPNRRSSLCRPAGTWPASGRATTASAACTRRRPTRSCAAPSRSTTQITAGRAGPLNPDRHQLHPRLPRPRHPRLGRPHAVERPVLALHQRPPPVQLRREVDRQRHAVGRVRAQRHRLWERVTRNVSAFLTPHVARRRAVRRHAGAGVLRQVRRGDQPAGRTIDAGQVIVEIGICAGEAGRVRHLPHRSAAHRRGRHQRIVA